MTLPYSISRICGCGFSHVLLKQNIVQKSKNPPPPPSSSGLCIPAFAELFSFPTGIKTWKKWFAIRALRSCSESNDSRYAIRLERFETVNHFATQWFNWFRSFKKLRWYGVLCSLSLYNLFVAWITMEMKSLKLIGLTYNVLNRLWSR